MVVRKLALAKSFRKRPVLTERRLWALLRDRRLDGLKFKRQVPIGPYIVDFVAFRHRFVVEADGPLHDAERDRERDDWLKSQSFRVLRFSNAQIELWPERIMDEIRTVAGLERVYSGPLEDHGRPSPWEV
jgi:very-short-patch-repair endonuclease